MSVLAPERTRGGLDPTARGVDEALIGIEIAIDWLAMLSPTHAAARWEAFRASGYAACPPLTYPALHADPPGLRDRLAALPLDRIDHPVVAGLLREKAHELDRQVDLVERRGRDGFTEASIALFGAPGPRLMEAANDILDRLEDGPDEPRDAGPDDLAAAARAMRGAIAARAPGFHFEVSVESDVGSSLMVNHGDLLIDRTARVPRSRVMPLIAHEVGVHVVTRHNGRQQPLRQLECGLAHYDALQEGLATLAEYLAGYLPARRLRVLAARVVAADMAVRGESIEAIFATLYEGHGLAPFAAFDTAVRAMRGGGLTKDAVYLDGLWQLLAHLRGGAAIGPLMAGKFALSHLPMLDALRAEGLVREPAILPPHLTVPEARARLDAVRGLDLSDLHHSAPAA